ncbi:hypothetical protein VNO80_01206 [Phaseolus coccineus]|uniref:Protein kinase domain-containing protein n=1 Tax=Phaseolus coccineus TaxID=3886 RepID=A0AAN9RMK9_PHACN
MKKKRAVFHLFGEMDKKQEQDKENSNMSGIDVAALEADASTVPLEFLVNGDHLFLKLYHQGLFMYCKPHAVVLTDFGLAKQFNESRRSNSTCGTVEYMALQIAIVKDHHDKAAN